MAHRFFGVCLGGLAMLGVLGAASGCGSDTKSDNGASKEAPTNARHIDDRAGTGAGGMTSGNIGGEFAAGAGGSSAGLNGPSGAGGALSLPVPAAPPIAAAGDAGISADAGTPSEGGAQIPPEPTTPPVVNPFTIVAHDPLSTFAADVDTASYDAFLRDVNLGSLPPATSVRLEEFVNYFAYDYPAPPADSTTPFAISLAAAPNLFNDGTMTVRVGIQGKQLPADTKKPANIVYLVDTSGSMATSDKLPLVKYTVVRSLDVLAPTDVVSIVTYSGSVQLVLPPTPASNRTLITNSVNALSANGGTNGAGGIQLAYEQAAAGFIEGGINHVVLCTDGDFNIGVSSNAELVDLITEKRKTGVTLTALGFGNVNNDSMMEAVSNAGNGTYSVITSQEQATNYVSTRLLSALMYIAKDMKIQVEWNPAQVYAYRLMGYEDRAIADNDFRNDRVDAGEVGAGHRVTALYQIVLNGHSLPEAATGGLLADGAAYDGPVEVAASDVVLVKVRYKAVDATDVDPALEVAKSLSPAQFVDSLETADFDFQWAAGIAGFAEILRGSPYADATVLPRMEGLFTARAGNVPERTEFVTAFKKARTILGE